MLSRKSVRLPDHLQLSLLMKPSSSTQTALQASPLLSERFVTGCHWWSAAAGAAACRCRNQPPKPAPLQPLPFLLCRFGRPKVQIRCPRAGLPRKALGQDPSCLFWFLVAPGVPWLVAAPLHLCLRLHMAFSSVCLLFCQISRVSLVRRAVTGFRAHPENSG